MVPPCFQINLQQRIVLRPRYHLVVQYRLLRVGFLHIICHGFIGSLIFNEVMRQRGFPFLWKIFHNSPVDFIDLIVFEHRVQAGQRFARFGKNHYPARRRYSFTRSESGLSPVLSPCTISPGALFTMIIWLSSYKTVILFYIFIPPHT